MISFDFNRHCTGCSACADVCPKSCIKIVEGKADFWVPSIDKSLCVDCNACSNVCPVLNTKEDVYEEQKIYCAYNKQEEDRKRGSSGSLMLVLARYVIEHGGVVYGAAFNDSLKVVHTRATTIKEVYRQCKSKYVQSNTRGIYRKVREDLRKGMMVLFVGTPCQCQALFNFTNAQLRTNLILVDFLCRGVPSQKLFDKCVEKYEESNRCKIKEFSFRAKSKLHQHNFSSVIEFNDGSEKVIVDDSVKFPFYQAYKHYFTFRESCYECRFIGKNHITDFTLGDFWGLYYQLPDFDEKGYSMFVVNSAKADSLYKQVSDSIVAKEYPIEDWKSYNVSWVSATPKSIMHKWFIWDYCHLPFDKVYHRFFLKDNLTFVEKLVNLVIAKFKL